MALFLFFTFFIIPLNAQERLQNEEKKGDVIEKKNDAETKVKEEVVEAIVKKAKSGKSKAKKENREKTESFEFYLQLALSNPDILDEAKANLDFAKAQQYRADWAWGPKIESTTVFSYVPADADTDQFGNNVDEILSLNLGPYLRQSFQLGIPLYTFGRIRIAQKLAKLGVEVSSLKADQAQDEVAYQTVQAYYGLQLANSMHDLLMEGSKMIKKELKKAEEDREFGDSKMKTKDFRKLQIFDAEVDGRLIEVKKLTMIADAGLRYLTKTKVVSVGRLNSSEKFDALLGVEDYLKLAEKHRPEVEMLRRAEHGVKLAQALAFRNWYPNIAFVSRFSFGLSTEDVSNTPICREIKDECVDTQDLFAKPSSNPLNFSSFTLGIAMKWEFDYWQNRGKNMEADARVLRVSAQKRRALGAIELEVKKLFYDATEAFERVNITQRRLTAARRWRDQFGLAAQSAGGDISDAVEPLKAFFQARGLHLQARYDFQKARAALHRAVGIQAPSHPK